MESADSHLSSLRAPLGPSAFEPTKGLVRNAPQLGGERLIYQFTKSDNEDQDLDARIGRRWGDLPRP